MEPYLQSQLKQVAFLGNYLPRKCGIATFTSDLQQAVAAVQPDMENYVLAMTDEDACYTYPQAVRFEVRENILSDYRRAAQFLRMNAPDVLCVQHEYGIFGGTAGAYLLPLLENVDFPVVTTLHTVLQNPNKDQHRLLRKLARLSSRLVVMSQRSAEFLTDIYAIPREKIDIIPHGIPDVPFSDSNFYKDKLDVEGQHLLLTFGLLSANKGIEYVIQALPDVLDEFPDLVYFVLGATHPHVLRQEGEQYRQDLMRLAEELGVAEHVRFHDRFVELDELIEYIGAADIYITPYLNQAQIVSGTLAYTVGAGKAVISTPYWYAEELLDDGRGVLVPFKDPQAIAEQVVHLLRDRSAFHAMRKRAYLYGRQMTWPQVAQKYLESFSRALQAGWQEDIVEELTVREARSDWVVSPSLPELRLDHLISLTDDLGLLQHAVFHLPNYMEGYTTDDNARAILLMLQLWEQDYSDQSLVKKLLDRYLAFLLYAYDPTANRFRNFLSYDHRWLEKSGSEDSQGRALWALGSVIELMGLENHYAEIAIRMFQPGMQVILETTSPRAWAFAVLGACAYLRRFPGDRWMRALVDTLAGRLVELYRANSSPDWAWFESIASYSNARLPHALLSASRWTQDREHVRIGLDSLQWLASIQTSARGFYSPVGSNGFYPRGGEKARFDQQPVEAAVMISACLEANRLSLDSSWLNEAQRSLGWYLGANDVGLPLCVPETGGCHDGLHANRLNRNQGAESTLSFLTALAEVNAALQKEKTQASREITHPSIMSSAAFSKTVPLAGKP